MVCSKRCLKLFNYQWPPSWLEISWSHLFTFKWQVTSLECYCGVLWKLWLVIIIICHLCCYHHGSYRVCDQMMIIINDGWFGNDYDYDVMMLMMVNNDSCDEMVVVVNTMTLIVMMMVVMMIMILIMMTMMRWYWWLCSLSLCLYSPIITLLLLFLVWPKM